MFEKGDTKGDTLGCGISSTEEAMVEEAAGQPAAAGKYLCDHKHTSE
jgi:hypothetical protein